jgi:hypothetical protein
MLFKCLESAGSFERAPPNIRWSAFIPSLPISFGVFAFHSMSYHFISSLSISFCVLSQDCQIAELKAALKGRADLTYENQLSHLTSIKTAESSAIQEKTFVFQSWNETNGDVVSYHSHLNKWPGVSKSFVVSQRTSTNPFFWNWRRSWCKLRNWCIL